MKVLAVTRIAVLAVGVGFVAPACRAHVETRASAEEWDGSPELYPSGEVKWGRSADAGPPEPEPPPVVDSDGDGVPDLKDACPNDPEDKDGFEDQDGCPEPDNDKDGIPDDRDECPDDAEEPGGDGDGCPDKARVTVRNGQLVIFGKVQFALGSDAILPKSEQLVDEMARALKEHPELKKIEIQGHTDSVGDDFYNLKLGQERAESVKRALVKRGVAPVRLTAKGYGEGNPLAPNDTPAGRAKNRRVEFVIVN